MYDENLCCEIRVFLSDNDISVSSPIALFVII